MGGWGLDGGLREHSWKLRGIVIGIYYSEWSPENDPHLRSDGYRNYGQHDLAQGKDECKRALQRVRPCPCRIHPPGLCMCNAHLPWQRWLSGTQARVRCLMRLGR